MHAVLQFKSNLTELASHTLRVRSSLDRKLATPGHAAIVRETEKGERLRSSQPLGLSISSSKAPELDQPRLVLMERQAEFANPLPKRHEHLPRITLILEFQYDVVGISDRNDFAGRSTPAPLLHPEVKHVMQEDITEDRADSRPLWRPCFRCFPAPTL